MAWQRVEDALSSEEAVALRKDIEVELADPKFFEKVLSAMSLEKPLRLDGEALVLLGPSAAGKSTLLPQMQVPSGALVVDGGLVRQVSASWRKGLDLAKSRELAGFSDFFEKYFKTPMDELKSTILEDSVRWAEKHVNLIVPDTASNFSATTKMIEKLRAAGYQMRFAAVYGDEEVLKSRGQARASEEGKQFTGKNWQSSVQAILKLQAYLESTGLVKDCGPVDVIDNSGSSTCSMSLEELRSKVS
eukprot:symbB.v1.2.017326.t1/scaffold1351.1/size123844/6